MPPSTPDRDIGRHDAEIVALQRDMTVMRSDMASMRGDMASLRLDLHRISEMLAETRGSWKVLLAVAGLSGAVGAGGTKLLHLIGITG